MPALEAPPTLATVDHHLDVVRDQILAHLHNRPVAVTWNACWRAVDRLLDERLAITGR